MVKESIYGKMAVTMTEVGPKIKYQDLDSIFGQMAENIKENG
jgi:hypothetical protein